MKTKKYFIISAFALLAYSCQDEEQGGVQPTPGQDVKFGASLEQSATRTIYGDEFNDGSKDVFPINWVNGDEVVVFSPDCASSGGVGQATYKVNVGEENSGKQNYANSLDKTGEIGVRWGKNTTGSFYSVYPASSLYTKVSSDCKTLTLTMPTQQDNTFERTESGIKAYPDMRACFMYAYTQNVQSGETVNLKYTPISTAVRFKLQGPLNDDNGPVTINYVRLYAPTGTNINGTYEFKDVTDTSIRIPEPKRGLNYVTMNVTDNNNTYLTLSAGESVELNAFLLTGHDITIDEKWYFEVAISDGTVLQKHIVTDGDEKENLTLKPGMIHKLPDLPPLTASGSWDVSNWMKNIQRNVYLSEISIPGAWYSMHSSYQPDANASSYEEKISNLYNNGVRAFHLDTRWRGTTYWVIGDTYLNEVKDLGVIDTDNHSFNEYGVTGGDKYLTMDAPSFKDCLNAITTHVRSDEYMVVICTFAQGSGNYKGYGTSGDGGWREAIRDACKDNDAVIDAFDLSPNTTVKDVLGKVIVIVNTYTPTEVTGKPLYVNLPMELSERDEDINVDGSISHKQGFTTNDYFSQPLKYMNSTETGITMYATYAQATTNSESGTGSTDSDRGYMPTFAERKQKAQNILTKSQRNHNDRENYSHNCWIYLGLGGYIPGSGLLGHDNYTDVSKSLNAWIKEKVEEMETNQAYYPVGIVLMNEAINYADVVKNILQMNNKYRKAYDPNRSPVTGDYINDSANSVQSAAPGYSSGMKDNQTDAIGWTRCK